MNPKRMPDPADGGVATVEEEPKQTAIERIEEHLSSEPKVKPYNGDLENDDKVVEFEEFTKKGPQKDETKTQQKVEGEPKVDDTKVDGAKAPEEGATGDDKDKSGTDGDGKSKTELPPLNPQQRPAEVNLEGFSDKEKELLTKKASREVREWAVSNIRAEKEKAAKLQLEVEDLRKQGDGRLPQSYLENEEAYVLSPTFKESVKKIQRAQNEGNFWEQQKVACRAGEKWKSREIVDGKVVTHEHDPGPEAEVFIDRQLGRIDKLLDSEEAKIDALRENHTKLHKQNVDRFKELEDHYFPQFKDETKAGEAGKYIQAMRGMLNEKGQGSNLLTGSFSKLYAYSVMRDAYVATLEAKIKQLETGKEIKGKVGPTSDDIKGDGGKGQDKDFTDFSDFTKITGREL